MARRPWRRPDAPRRINTSDSSVARLTPHQPVRESAKSSSAIVVESAGSPCLRSASAATSHEWPRYRRPSNGHRRCGALSDSASRNVPLLASSAAGNHFWIHWARDCEPHRATADRSALGDHPRIRSHPDHNPLLHPEHRHRRHIARNKRLAKERPSVRSATPHVSRPRGSY